MRNPVLFSALAVISTCVAQFGPEQCGPTAGNQRCRNNKCCSQYGWCGTSNAYCKVGCQPDFGRCTGLVSSVSPSKASSSSIVSVASPSGTADSVASPASISTNGRCGSSYGGKTCLKSVFGNCCSQYNWCGTTADHCKISKGCQPGFGTCSGTISSSSLVLPSTSVSQSASSSFAAATSSIFSVSSVLQPSSSLVSSSASFSSASVSLANIYSSSTAVSSSIVLVAVSSSSQPATSNVPSSSPSALISTPTSSATSASSWAVSVSSSSAQASSSSILSSPITSSSPSEFVTSISSLIVPSSSAAAVISTTASSTSAAITPAVQASSISISIDAVQPPLPSGSTINHILRPARDPSIDRNSPDNFVPASPLNLYYADSADPSYHTKISAPLLNGAQGILLENIASILSVTCTGTDISITADSQAAANDIASWPSGTLLFTLHEGCNSVDERGVYVLTSSSSDGASSSIITSAQSSAASATPTPSIIVSTMEALIKRQTQGYGVRYKMSQKRIEQLVERWNQIWAAAETALAAAVAQAQPSAFVSATVSQNVPSPIPTGSCGGYYPGGRKVVGGVPYNVYCGRQATYPTKRIDDIAATSFTECLIACNTLANCAGAMYRVSLGSDGKQCSRWSELAIPRSGKDWSGKYDVALKIVETPPTTSSSVSVGGQSTFVTSSVGPISTGVE